MSETFDRITADQMRAAGWKKWTEFPGTTGAWIAEMDFGTASAVRDVLRRAAENGEGLGYLPSGRLLELQQAFTAFVAARFGWSVQPADVRPVPDVLTALQATIRLFSRPGSPIVLPTPAYMPFLTLPGALEREIIQVPLRRDADRYRYDLDALDAAFAAGGDLLVLCNPHNPVGRVLDREELVAISEVVQRHGGRVFADEIHAPLVYSPARHVPYATISATAAEHTVTALSASKGFNLPGLKCAQLVLSNDEDRQTWARAGSVYEDQASTLGALAATAAFADGGPWLDDVLGYLDGNRSALSDLVAAHLPGVGYTPPEGTYLAWLDFRRSAWSDPARVLRQRAEIVVTPGALCGDGGAGHVRVNIATPRPVLAGMVERMGVALAAA